jgi:hypothetical protein
LHYRQGTAVRVEYGGAATAADGADANVISHAFPHTYGQLLAHFLPTTANVPDAPIIAEHPAVRYASSRSLTIASRYQFLTGKSSSR